jgi:hypothetical protein
MDALAKARPNMIATLGSLRDTLEDLGGGLGVTDRISGSVVLEMKWRARPDRPEALRCDVADDPELPDGTDRSESATVFPQLRQMVPEAPARP